MLGRMGVVIALSLSAFAFIASPASAQQSSVVGRWTVVANWDGPRYDGVSFLDFHANGTFTDGAGATGTWRATETGITFQYDQGAASVYTADRIDDYLVGRMTNGQIHGVFVLIPQSVPAN